MSLRGVAVRWLRGLTAVCAIAGPTLLLLSASIGLYDWNFVRHAASTIGTVSQFDERPEEDEDGDAIDDKADTYAPVFTFIVDGETYTIHSGSSAKRPGFAVGQQVPVLYDPENPEHARIDSAGLRWHREIQLGAIGVVTGLIGAGGIIFRRRERVAQGA